MVTYFTAINCDFKQHFRTELHVTADHFSEGSLMGTAAADGTAQLRGEAAHVTHHLGPQHLVRVGVGVRVK